MLHPACLQVFEEQESDFTVKSKLGIHENHLGYTNLLEVPHFVHSYDFPETL